MINSKKEITIYSNIFTGDSQKLRFRVDLVGIVNSNFNSLDKNELP